MRLPAARLAGSLTFGPSYLTPKDAMKHRDTPDYKSSYSPMRSPISERCRSLFTNKASNHHHGRHSESLVAPCSFRGAVRDFDARELTMVSSACMP